MRAAAGGFLFLSRGCLPGTGDRSGAARGAAQDEDDRPEGRSVMAKCAIAVQGTTYGTVASAGLGAAFGSAAVTPVGTFTAAKNPDGSAVKDTRK